MIDVCHALLVDKFLDLIAYENLEGIRAFLALGVSPNVCDAKGRTPLMLAADGNLQQILKDLIAAGGDVERRDAEGMTALMHALRWSDKAANTVRTLLEAGAECERPDNRGYYPSDYTMMAALWGWEVPSELEFDSHHLDIMRAAKQGDLHILAKSLRSTIPHRIITNALILAISERNQEGCRLLLAEGADRRPRSNLSLSCSW